MLSKPRPCYLVNGAPDPAITLVRLYTANGPLWVSAEQLNGTREQLSIYTDRGTRRCDSRAAEPGGVWHMRTTVHRANLFATLELAIADRERIYAEMDARRVQS